MGNIMISFSKACTIARELTGKDTKSAIALREACAKTNHLPTFLIMRRGHPKDWGTNKEIKTKRGCYHHPVFKGPFIAENLDGVQVKADTIEQFAKAIGATQRVHIYPLLRGERSNINGWYIPHTLNTSVSLQDKYGTQYPPMTVRELAVRYGKSPASVIRLLSGRKKTIGDLALASTNLNVFVRPSKYKIGKIVVSRNGITIKAGSVPKLAAKLNTTPPSIYRVLHGYKENQNGFVVENVEIVEKQALKEVSSYE